MTPDTSFIDCAVTYWIFINKSEGLRVWVQIFYPVLLITSTTCWLALDMAWHSHYKIRVLKNFCRWIEMAAFKVRFRKVNDDKTTSLWT
jgi:hypothetical protein